MEENKYLPGFISISQFLWYLDWSKLQYQESNVYICIQSTIEINQMFSRKRAHWQFLASDKSKFAHSEKGNCKKTWETYWAYYGKYAGPSIQNTEPICKVYITENIIHTYFCVIIKSDMK